MKGKLNNYLLKLFSLVLAFILVFPTEIFAMAMDDKASTYNASTSIMGLATQTQNPEENSTESTDEKQTLIKSEISTDETNEYLIEKSATLSKTTGQIDYKILVKSKKSDDKDKNQTAIFAITQNTELKDLRVEKVQELSADGTEKDAEYTQNTASLFTPQDNQRTFGITTTSAENAMVYYLSAKLSDEALADIDKKSPNMDLEFAIKKLENIYQSRYALEIAKPQENDIIIDHNGDFKNQEESLKEITDNTHQYKAIYKEESQGLFANTPAQITWTDYINNKDDKEFTYNIDLDENQDTTNSQIKIEYYQASEKGYILNEEFTKTLDFTNSLNLQIPQGYIAKVELNTRPKDKTNAKEYVFNGIKIPNPTYTEEKTQPTEEQTSDDADPLPADTSKEENSKTKEEDERQKTEESNKSAQSAIELNKDAYISDLKENNMLTTNLEKATKQIALSLESYNKEEINWDDFKASIQTIAEAQNIDSTQTQEILSSLIAGLNEDKYKVASIDTKKASAFDTANSDQENDNTLATVEGTELPKDNLSEEEIKSLIKEEFTKEKSGQITKEELETSLATIREENNISNEYFLNILSDLYQNGEIANDGEDNIATIDTDKTKEEALAEKLAEENLSTEDFIAFLQSYVKSYDIKEEELEQILKESEVEKVIADFTIDEIVAAAYLDELNPHVFADTTSPSFSNEKFITELEYFTETLTRATNEEELFEIVKNNFTKDDTNSSDQLIRSNYVGWKINIPGVDESGMDITEIKKDKYKYDNLNFSIYAPVGQSLKDYKVVVEDGEGETTSYSGSMTEKKGEHYLYSFPIQKDKLTEKGYNIYVVAKAPKKRQNYAIGLKVSPDKNYVNELVKDFDKDFDELSQKYPFLIKWKDTSDANPYRNGINLIDTRMVYLEPNGWQDLFPYNEFRSLDYNDNITDTDNIKNTVSMFGNIDKNGQITWTISETFPAEDLVNKNRVGIDAYSAKTDGQGLTGPSIQILVPNNTAGYDAKNLGNISISELQKKIGNRPGTIVNYTYTDKTTNKEDFTTLSLDSGKSASIAYKPSLLQREEGAEKDTSGLAYLHKVQEHKDGSGYEVALSKDQANTMKAFIPSNPNANPRYNDPAFTKTGVIVFCLNPGKPEPTRQYKFNGTITKGEWSTAEKDWETNGRAIAALATANEAKASPLYKMNGSVVNDKFYSSLYEYVLRLYWYGQELAEEYHLDEQSYYKIIQYNLYYWIAGENYAESFRNGGGYNPYYFSSAEYSYAQGLKNRISQGKDWDKVNYDKDIQIFYYGHDKTRSYQNTITGDTKRRSEKGSVTVNKLDKAGTKLQGAAFQLLDEDKKTVIKTLVTDESGVAKFDNLDYGTYYLKEVQGPRGYQFKDQISEVVVGGEKEPHINFNATNTINEIDFRKIDEKKLALKNIGFRLKRNGQLTSDEMVKSGTNGKFGWKALLPGSYEVVEYDLSAQPNYSDNEGKTVATFTVNSNNIVENKAIISEFKNGNNTVDIINKKNSPLANIEFTKVDSKDPEKVLAGAEFILEYKKTGETIYKELPGSRKTTDNNGNISWKDLEVGDYRVIETKAPGAEYDTEINLGEKATFEVVEDGEFYKVKNISVTNNIIKNETKPKEGEGSFEFEKIDEDTNEKLQGVEFTLTSDGQVYDGNKYFDYKSSKITDMDGKISFDKLLPGTYILKETKPLAGYEANADTWKVVVSNNNETKIFDSKGTDITKSNASKIVAGDGKGPIDIKVAGTNLGSIKSSIKPTDNPKIFDLDLTITPESDPFSGRVNLYYVYDNDNDKYIRDFVNKNSSKVTLRTGFKVTSDDQFKDQFYEIYNKIPRNSRNSQTVVVTLFSKTYKVVDTRRMISGFTDLKSDQIPVFSYFNGKLNDDLKQYVYNDNIKYRENYSSNDFSEVLDYINGGKSRLDGKNIQLTAKDGMSLDNDLNSKTINGSNLVAKKENTITTKINITNAEKFAGDTPVLKSLTLDRSDLSSAIPSLLFNTTTSSDNTSGQGNSNGANASTGPAVMASPITNKKKQPDSAKLTIKKVDGETKIGLEGAKFRIYNTKSDAENDNFYLQEVSSNEHGYAVFDSIEIQPNTTYYVKEIAAPDGYKITSAITEVKSSPTSDNTINAEIKNEKNNAKFELYKKDADGNSLEGVVFELTNTNKNTTETLTTNSNGYISYDKLETDTIYELKEIKTLDGYKLNDSPATITVDEDGNVSWDDNSLIKEKYDHNSKVVTETTTKEKPLETWKSNQATYTNASKAWPSYMNTLDYAELTNQETKQITQYIMLKPDDDKNGGYTDKATTLNLSTRNIKIDKVELFDVPSGNKQSIAQEMRNQTVSNSLSKLGRVTVENKNAGNITMGYGNTSLTQNTIQPNSANAWIKFPVNGTNSRFGGNWAMLVKVTATVDNEKEGSEMKFDWTTDIPKNSSTSSTQQIPALVKTEEIPGNTTSPSPTFTVINEKKPSINFVKEDKYWGEKLYGAQFVLYKGNDKVEGSITSSDKDGKFGFANLEDGEYTVYEIASPLGYPYLEEKLEVATFTVDHGKITNLATNQAFGNTKTENPNMDETYVIYNKVNDINFKKVNKDGEALKGATFKLDRVWVTYNENGEIESNRETVLKDIETLDDGLISLSATTPGRYQLVETSAPEGYKHISTTNKAGGLIVAEFTVEERSLAIKNISIGDKYFQSMEDIKDNDSLNIVNKKKVNGELQVNKVEKDGDSIKPLSGARFLLKDLESGQYVKTDGTFTTNSGAALTNGDATVNYQNLPVGEYELREFKSPDGYIRTINTWKIEVNDDGKTTISENPKLDNDVKATITEETSTTPANLQLENKSNEIEFTKIDSKADDALEGVEFEIWWDQQADRNNTGTTYKKYKKISKDDGSTTFTTGADGKIKLTNLKTGHYKIYETKMPEGYYAANKPIDNEPIKDATGEFVKEFFVDIDGDIKKNEHGVVDADEENLITTIENTPYTGKFRVQKVGEDGVEKLKGAEFKLYKVDENGEADTKNSIDQVVVKDSDGEEITGRIEFADLENGEYLLEETKAPKGYGISNTTWNISVNNGKVNITSTNGSADFTRTDDTITLNVINKKASYPSTGGAGTFIGFALIGTAVMLAGIAYFAIYQNDKNRRRSDRYGR